MASIDNGRKELITVIRYINEHKTKLTPEVSTALEDMRKCWNAKDKTFDDFINIRTTYYTAVNDFMLCRNDDLRRLWDVFANMFSWFIYRINWMKTPHKCFIDAQNILKHKYISMFDLDPTTESMEQIKHSKDDLVLAENRMALEVVLYSHMKDLSVDDDPEHGDHLRHLCEIGMTGIVIRAKDIGINMEKFKQLCGMMSLSEELKNKIYSY